MPYNSAGTSFASRQIVPIFQTSVKEGTIDYPPGTSAQLAANSAYTAASVTATASQVEAAKNRTTGMIISVPTDAPCGVAFANLSTVVAGQPTPIQSVSQTFATTGAPGFTVPPGGVLALTPFNDALWAICPTGFTPTIYFQDI